MSTRSIAQNGSGPAKFRPPPPSFAPPTLPVSQKSDDSYSRKKRSNQPNFIEKSKSDILNDRMKTEVVTAVAPLPKILVEETEVVIDCP